MLLFNSDPDKIVGDPLPTNTQNQPKFAKIKLSWLFVQAPSGSGQILSDFFRFGHHSGVVRSAPGASGRSSVDLEPTPPGRKRLGPAPLVPNPLRSGHSPPPLRFQPLHFCPNLQKIRQNLPRSGLHLTKQPRSL